ncbi:MAG: class I SAM-dependent methyltransferase [Bacteroidetes bacterium]|nr:class I SAM-dependent methyltransferase [Bacteroidota bacterium]MBS1591529.1 class I SAM-dependent methyltransferase [Bacteroidota bacterium]MBS1670869.1 class I SAM-dependent methyltransferase [Bacteroidota bacterium]
MIGNNLFHYLKTRISIDKPHTQTSIAEQTLIQKYSFSKKSAVEIGVFEGVNTCIIAESLLPNGCLYAVDPFIPGRLGFSYIKLISHKYIKKRKLNSKIIWIEEMSDVAADLIPNNIDFIFIDGDHSYEGVKKDFELYAPKLSKDGILAFHDARIFVNGWTKEDWGPVRLLNEVIYPSNQWKVVDEVDSLVLFQKNML